VTTKTFVNCAGDINRHEIDLVTLNFRYLNLLSPLFTPFTLI